MYEKDSLIEYIESSELRIFSKEIKVRLSKELALKYDRGMLQQLFRKHTNVFEYDKYTRN